MSMLATNIAETGLLGYCICSVDQNTVSHRHGKSILIPSVLTTSVDAGILYCVSILAEIGCYAT